MLGDMTTPLRWMMLLVTYVVSNNYLEHIVKEYSDTPSLHFLSYFHWVIG